MLLEHKINKASIKIIDYVHQLNYEKISIERINDSSLFFNILIGDSLKLHIEFYMNDNNKNKEHFFYLLYKNKECISTGYCNMNKILPSKFNEIINDQKEIDPEMQDVIDDNIWDLF